MDGSAGVVLSVLRHSLVPGVIWLLLTGSDFGSWIVGAPAVLLAAIARVHFADKPRINFLRLLVFLPIFLFRSLIAAFDIAWRTLAPRRLLSPGLVTYDICLGSDLARVAFMNTLSLLPGTLSAALEGDRLTVHVLDEKRDHPAELARLEATISRIFPQVRHD